MGGQVRSGSKSITGRSARIISLYGSHTWSQHEHGKGCFYRIALPMEAGIRFLDPREIAYCEAQGNYTNIVLFNGDTTLISKTLKWLEVRLSRQEFFRSHGSCIVALRGIAFLGRGSVILDNGAEVPVSRRKRDALLQRLQ